MPHDMIVMVIVTSKVSIQRKISMDMNRMIRIPMKNVRSYRKLTVINRSLLVMLMTTSPSIFRMQAILDPVVSSGRWVSFVESSLDVRHPSLDAVSMASDSSIDSEGSYFSEQCRGKRKRSKK
ncbi:lysophospholipase L1-like esterase [Anopheles sinensis]|uniref:Lysophospholipase L1-like esterase n=1 Tax=Anopheles sinensis TaxID=74873 RepID=A0A084VCC5_ANOSI|nr:lysophospholipase L1-like esterase [Anopheles sinensis]